MAEITVVDRYQERFKFLFPGAATPRYRLFAPDLMELRWSVFDHDEKVTIGYGRAPEDAVDVAISVVEHRRHLPEIQNELNIH